MKCIICLLEKEATIEHVFPDAIGGTLTIARLCKTCNSTFGQSADTTLTHHPLVQLAVASARSDAALLARVLGVGEMDDGTRVIPIKDPLTDALGVRVEPSVKKSPDGKDVQAVFDDRDERHAKGVMRRWLADTGQQVPEEQFDAVFETITKRVEEPNPAAHHQIVLTPDHQNPDAFAHGLLKIAYELAWRVLGDDWLDDPIAVTIRQSLKSWPSNADMLVGNTSFMRSVEVRTADALPGDPMTTHAGAVVGANGRVVAAVRIFNIMASEVVVSEDASRYAAFASRQPTGTVFLQHVAIGAGWEEMAFAEAIHRHVTELLERNRETEARSDPVAPPT